MASRLIEAELRRRAYDQPLSLRVKDIQEPLLRIIRLCSRAGHPYSLDIRVRGDQAPIVVDPQSASPAALDLGGISVVATAVSQMLRSLIGTQSVDISIRGTAKATIDLRPHGEADNSLVLSATSARALAGSILELAANLKASLGGGERRPGDLDAYLGRLRLSHH